MANIMKKLLIEAFQAAGQKLPRHPQEEKQELKPPAKKDTGARSPKKKNSADKRKLKPRSTFSHSSRLHHEPPLDTSCYASGDTNVKKESLAKNPAAAQDYVITLATDTTSLLASADAQRPAKMIRHNFNGCLISMADPGKHQDTIELKLGLDFGTSSTKVVIADPQQDKAFAVPFFDCVGIGRYLLPGIIFKNGHYNFDGHGAALRDLKLNLLGIQPQRRDLIRAVAFIALTIRYARSWIFTEHAHLYRKSEIFWSLNIGMPSDDANDPRLQPRFKHIGLAGWIASRLDQPLTDAAIERCLIEAQIMLSDSSAAPMIDLEITAIPELVAQIYGHISSDSFDPHGRNIFMIVDVGAGTVDSSLFHVYRDKKVRWNFEMYTKAVEANGSINLHRNRLSWWAKAIQRFYPERADLLQDTENAKSRSDCMTHIPERLENYFSKANIHFENPETTHPDKLFFKKRVKEQIFYRTYAAAKLQQHLLTDELKEMPTFLCGGGMLMPFYQQLNNELGKAHPNASWLKAKRMEMSPPKKILAPGISPEAYQRLSVAYGLSMMRLGTLEQSIGAQPIQRNFNYTASEKTYVSKDMV